MDKKKFSILRVISIALPIVSIGLLAAWVMGQEVLHGSKPHPKVKVEITLLTFAINQYYDRYGHLPKQVSGILDFGEQLSKVPPNDDTWKEDRPMYLDYHKHNIKASNSNYADANATSTTIFDPYGTAYHYIFKQDREFEIISLGIDGELGTEDDVKLESDSP